MCNFGELSKAQRAMLELLATKRAVAIATAVSVDGKGRQTAENLRAKGLIEADRADYWRVRVWLSEAGQRCMRSVQASRNLAGYKCRWGSR